MAEIFAEGAVGREEIAPRLNGRIRAGGVCELQQRRHNNCPAKNPFRLLLHSMCVASEPHSFSVTPSD